ncbi:MAG: DUF2332 domain-containing protein [Pseudomonadales bacterium]
MNSIEPRERQSGFDRDPETLARRFHVFGRVEAPHLDSPMYAELSYGVSQDRELVELAAHTRLGQPPPNMLFAAVQYLLLSGVEHELRRHYPAVSGEPRPPLPAFPAFREFCLTQRSRIIEQLETRLTQTNVIQRCACLLPAFVQVQRETARPLALLEVGPSAGLNLNWDRYRYRYVDGSEREVAAWGDVGSPVSMTSELRGGRLPPLDPAVFVTSRTGIDIHPIDIDDEDQVRWLQALIWPEHVERHGRLLAAVRLAREHRPALLRGDAVTEAAGLLTAVPPDAAVVVFATFVLYQMTREQRRALLQSVAAFARDHERRVDLITMDSLAGSDSELALTTYLAGTRETRRLARVNAHGRWLRWQGEAPKASNSGD